MKLRTLAITIFVSLGTNAHADCFDDAGTYHSVNPWILRAIAANESGCKANAINRNRNGTFDYGCTQTNSVHLPELARNGIARDDLFDACKSVYVAAWLVQKKIRRWGNTCTAIGAYHSETPAKRDAYIRDLQITLSRWGITWRC